MAEHVLPQMSARVHRNGNSCRSWSSLSGASTIFTSISVGTERDARYQFVRQLVKTQATALHQAFARVILGGRARIARQASSSERSFRQEVWLLFSENDRLWTFDNTLNDATGAFSGSGLNSSDLHSRNWWAWYSAGTFRCQQSVCDRHAVFEYELHQFHVGILDLSHSDTHRRQFVHWTMHSDWWCGTMLDLHDPKFSNVVCLLGRRHCRDHHHFWKSLVPHGICLRLGFESKVYLSRWCSWNSTELNRPSASRFDDSNFWVSNNQ